MAPQCVGSPPHPMNFNVCYIDDQAHSQSIEANTARMAAWRFLQQDPRSDTSQITVESHPSEPWRSSQVTHYRACDLASEPAPFDEAEPDLAIRVTGGRETSYVVSGSAGSLRLFAARLLRCLDEFPTRPNPLRLKHVCGFFVIPGSGSRGEHWLSFEIDPDVEQYWNRRHGIKGLWTEYGRCLVLLLLFAFTCIGIWTVARWVF